MKYKLPIIIIMWIIWGPLSDLFPILNQDIFSIIPVIITICLIFNFYPHISINKYRKLEKILKQKLELQNQISINNHITLKQQNEEIFVYYNNEIICKLEEFKEKYINDYEKLLKTAIQSNTPLQEPIKEENKVIPFEHVIQEIEAYNIDILDEEISLGLYNCANQLKYLQKLCIEYPTNNDKLNKLEDYYLPILLDILENYIKVSASDDATHLKKKLNQTLFLVNEAIKNITRSLFDEEKLNLNVDMNVLESLLKKDGLVLDEINSDDLKAMMETANE